MVLLSWVTMNRQWTFFSKLVFKDCNVIFNFTYNNIFPNCTFLKIKDPLLSLPLFGSVIFNHYIGFHGKISLATNKLMDFADLLVLYSWWKLLYNYSRGPRYQLIGCCRYVPWRWYGLNDMGCHYLPERLSLAEQHGLSTFNGSNSSTPAAL